MTNQKKNLTSEITLGYGRGRAIVIAYLDFCSHVDRKYTMVGILDNPENYIKLIDVIGNCAIIEEVSHKYRRLAVFRQVTGYFIVPISIYSLKDGNTLYVKTDNAPLVEFGYINYNFLRYVKSGSIIARKSVTPLSGDSAHDINVWNNIRRVIYPDEPISVELEVSLYDSF